MSPEMDSQSMPKRLYFMEEKFELHVIQGGETIHVPKVSSHGRKVGTTCHPTPMTYHPGPAIWKAIHHLKVSSHSRKVDTTCHPRCRTIHHLKVSSHRRKVDTTCHPMCRTIHHLKVSSHARNVEMTCHPRWRDNPCHKMFISWKKSWDDLSSPKSFISWKKSWDDLSPKMERQSMTQKFHLMGEKLGSYLITQVLYQKMFIGTYSLPFFFILNAGTACPSEARVLAVVFMVILI